MLRHSWNDVVDDVNILIVIVVVIRLSIWIADNVKRLSSSPPGTDNCEAENGKDNTEHHHKDTYNRILDARGASCFALGITGVKVAIIQ